jgi:hypothetical protein
MNQKFTPFSLGFARARFPRDTTGDSDFSALTCGDDRGRPRRRSPALVMLGMYGAWIEGSTDADIVAIKRSMEAGAAVEAISGDRPPQVPASPLPGATKVPPTGDWGRLGSRKIKKNNGGADGTRTRPKSNKISKLLNRKDPDSPLNPYDPQILHRISHCLRVPEARPSRPSRHCSWVLPRLYSR